MKEQIYKAITENRGYVVNVDYDKFLHWNCEECSFIILGKGKNINLFIDNYDHVIAQYPDPEGDKCIQQEANLKYLVNSLDFDESYMIQLSNTCRVMIIKKELMVEQIDLEGLVYTSNLYTAEGLLNYFCDRKDYYVELVVPLDNLKLLNRVIKEKPYCIKFIRRIKSNVGDKLGIVTNYNAEDRIRRALKVLVSDSIFVNDDDCKPKINSSFNKVSSYNKSDDDIDKFIRDCKYEYSDLSNIVSDDQLDNLMHQYSESCVDKYKNIKKGFLDSDEAYMNLYQDLKPIE